jgi:hypothetical protein
MRPRLRLFTGEEASVVDGPKASIRFGELFQMVAEANRFKRTWLTDFEDDHVELPVDLYEVLSSYWSLRPGA